ncbi:hypothetical protein C0081_13710 [Cohaesibacter celericrescens]|uniref:Uncharacterized protein n=1 Tax=Cohaesibacter celericrescens TaxID=2067669 RepID=A0A2N5XQ74_9HYPH|nr:hypothetical protein C0081_13710 [Cohaesibacter celericrescens]
MGAQVRWWILKRSIRKNGLEGAIKAISAIAEEVGGLPVKVATKILDVAASSSSTKLENDEELVREHFLFRTKS